MIKDYIHNKFISLYLTNGSNKLECYIALGQIGLSETKTLDYWDHSSVSVVNAVLGSQFSDQGMICVARIPDLDYLLSLALAQNACPCQIAGGQSNVSCMAKVSDNSYITIKLYIQIYNSTLKLGNDKHARFFKNIKGEDKCLIPSTPKRNFKFNSLSSFGYQSNVCM